MSFAVNLHFMIFKARPYKYSVLPCVFIRFVCRLNNKNKRNKIEMLFDFIL